MKKLFIFLLVIFTIIFNVPTLKGKNIENFETDKTTSLSQGSSFTLTKNESGFIDQEKLDSLNERSSAVHQQQSLRYTNNVYAYDEKTMRAMDTLTQNKIDTLTKYVKLLSIYLNKSYKEEIEKEKIIKEKVMTFFLTLLIVNILWVICSYIMGWDMGRSISMILGAILIVFIMLLIIKYPLIL